MLGLTLQLSITLHVEGVNSGKNTYNLDSLWTNAPLSASGYD